MRWGLAAWVVGRSIIRDRNPDILVKSIWRQSLTDYCRAVRYGKNQPTLARVLLGRRGTHRDPAFSFSGARSREHHPDFAAILLTTCSRKILWRRVSASPPAISSIHLSLHHFDTLHESRPVLGRHVPGPLCTCAIRPSLPVDCSPALVMWRPVNQSFTQILLWPCGVFGSFPPSSALVKTVARLIRPRRGEQLPY